MLKQNQYNNIRKLCNKNLEYISRASSMLCLGFGKRIVTNNYVMEEKLEVCEYRLHIQCSWRVINDLKKQILFGNYDIFEPKQDDEYYENFNWDKKNNNLFDQKSESWIKYGKDILVTEIEVNELNDLRIYFSNGDVLETFIAGTNNNECWRFIECDSMQGAKANHIVVYENVK